MKIVWKIITAVVFFSILCVFPVYAEGKEDEIVFGEEGKYGSVYGEEYINEVGEQSNWLTVQLGERGVRIVNEENREIVIVDKYGGIYLNGEVYVNGEKYEKVKEHRGVFYPQNGFLYLMVIISLGISVLSLIKKRG